jgi:Ca2+/Na+ antiporter
LCVYISVFRWGEFSLFQYRRHVRIDNLISVSSSFFFFFFSLRVRVNLFQFLLLLILPSFIYLFMCISIQTHEGPNRQRS